MITQLITNSDPFPYTAGHNGLALFINAGKINSQVTTPENSVCICRCEYVEKVFAETGTQTSDVKNDKTALLFQKLITADTITIYLCYGTTRIEITDNTYGTFYTAGYFTQKPLYVGFVADWHKIKAALGTGTYWFETERTLLGTSDIVYSIYYELLPFTDLLANGTVRIDTWNTGTILSSPFDYEAMTTELPMGWFQSYRIMGKVMPKVPKLTVDNYYNQNYELIQIQDKITDNYELETELLPASVSNQIIYDNLLANVINVSDFNYYNEEVIRELRLYPQEIIKKSFAYNQRSIFKISLIPYNDNIVKNNF